MPPTREQVEGRLGLLFVERKALSAGCVLIPFPPDLDAGIDAFVEFPADAGARLVALQVKKGSSFFDGAGARYQADARHLRSWSRYGVPVVLVVVREDESDAYWMNVTQYVRERPQVLGQGSHVLRPQHRFDVVALERAIGPVATSSVFDDVIAALVSSDPELRLSSLAFFYPLRNDKRTPFCLSAAMREETDRVVMTHMCDFYSRYLPHPEVSFADVEPALRAYAASAMREAPTRTLMNMLIAFGDDDETGDWSGMEEIYDISEDEIWDRHAIITRGTVQQGIAEVIRVAATPERLLAIVSDAASPISERRAAAGLFGYLGYSCDLSAMEALRGAVTDGPLGAILFWLRYWIRVEAEGNATA